MFEVAELGHKVSKADYNEKVPTLRTQLLTTQQQLSTLNFSVIILISGVDGGGKGEVINLLNEWLDPRFMRTNAYDSPSDEEKERPKFWRFWRTMPAKGTIGIYVGSWYSNPIAQRVHKDTKEADLQLQLTQIKQLEQELADDGTLIIKCWLHLKKEQQKKRLKLLEKNPETAWQVTERDKKHLKMYDDFAGVAETILKETSSTQNPWRIIDGSDIRYSSLTVGQHVLDKITAHIAAHEIKQSMPVAASTAQVIHGNQPRILDSLDLSLELDKKDYNEKLNFYQGKLNKLARHAHQKEISSVLVFEGWDAGGKGGGQSGVSPMHLMPETIRLSPSQLQPMKNAYNIIYGASGGICHAPAASLFMIVAGMGAYWSNESKALPANRNGRALIQKSAILKKP